MFFILSKVLSFLLSPIWWILILMILYFVFSKYKKRRIFLISSLLMLLIFSNQLLFYHVSGWWEGDLERSEELDHYDGIILLGGFSNYRSQFNRIQFTQSSDRMNQALALYKQGKADWFIFTGGSARIIVKEQMEGEFLKDYLKLMGIPNDSLLVEWQSRNTHENAVETKKMLKVKGVENGRFLLVTSGFHMKRALGCFKKEGIDVDSFKTDALQSYLPPDIADSITPSAGTLAMWERLFREWVGYVAYKIKGFV